MGTYLIIATLNGYSSVIDEESDSLRAMELWLKYKAGYGYDWIITMELEGGNHE